MHTRFTRVAHDVMKRSCRTKTEIPRSITRFIKRSSLTAHNFNPHVHPVSLLNIIPRCLVCPALPFSVQ